VEAPGGECGNVQRGAEGDRLSTISLLGCSTSVALATGPTDEEEEEEEKLGICMVAVSLHSVLTVIKLIVKSNRYAFCSNGP